MKKRLQALSLSLTLACTPAFSEENQQLPTDDNTYTQEDARQNICWQFNRSPNCDPSQFERLERSELCDVFFRAIENAPTEHLNALLQHTFVLNCHEFIVTRSLGLEA